VIDSVTRVDPVQRASAVTQEPSAVQIADSLHDAGDRLLARGLGKVLSTYDAVCYSGSFYLDLMAWPDLDVYLPLDSSAQYLERFLTLGHRVASVCDVISLRYKNHVRYPEEPLPHGLYWGIRVRQDASVRWKIDIWALPPDVINANQRELDRLKAKLTPENRKRIVELKRAFLTPEGRTPVFSGYHIYCAVLDHGLAEFAKVKEYLADKGVSF